MTELQFRESFTPPANPIDLFNAWLAEANTTEPSYATAMQVASVGADGMPSVRTVLLRGWDARGFVFYTNANSRKGNQLKTHGKAAATLYWKTQLRQIHFEGAVEKIADAESDAYFAARPYGHKIAAAASQQSEPLESREALLARVVTLEKLYPTDIPRPAHWHGFRIIPNRIEFWQEGKFRLHDRFVYSLNGNGWSINRLNP